MINMTKAIRTALFIGFTALFAASCSKEPSVSSTILQETLPVTEVLDTKVADFTVTREMVEAFLMSESEKERPVVSISSYPSEDNPLLYVVNYENGWKIIPGDSRFGYVLAQSESGTLDLSKKSENPGFNIWVKSQLDEIKSVRGSQLKNETMEENARAWSAFLAPAVADQDKKLTAVARSNGSGELMWAKIKYSLIVETDTVANKGHLLQTKWGQGSPWNVSMYTYEGEKCAPGCAAVAVAQVLYYYHNKQNRPSGLYHSVKIDKVTRYTINGRSWFDIKLKRGDFVLNSPRWEEMPLTKGEDNPDGYKYVSDLMLDVGVRMNMKYNVTGSSVIPDSNGYFDTSICGLSGTWAQYSAYNALRAVVNSLDADNPVIVAATDENGDGHTWIIDGYVRVERTRTRRYEWWPVNMIPAGTAVYEYKTTTELLQQYNYNIYQGLPVYEPDGIQPDFLFRMNWGLDDSLDNDALYSSSSYINSAWYDFNYNKVVQYNLSAGELTYFGE